MTGKTRVSGGRLEAGVHQGPDQVLVLEAAPHRLPLTDLSVIVDVQEAEDSLSPVYRQLLTDPLIQVKRSEDLHHFTQIDQQPKTPDRVRYFVD